MKIFGKKEVPPEQISGTETIRHHLKARSRVRALVYIAGDINDIMTAEANRLTAKTIAGRMAGDASPDVAASIAKTLIGGFSSEVNRKVGDVSEAMLRAFVDGGELPDAIKMRLAEYLHGGHTTYDAEADRLKPTYGHEPKAITAIPPQYVNPDPAIARAQAAYHAALAAARPPEPTRSPTPGQENAGHFAKRPGFA